MNTPNALVWTQEDELKFDQAVRKFGFSNLDRKNQVVDYIGTKTRIQIVSYARSLLRKLKNCGSNDKELIAILEEQPERKENFYGFTGELHKKFLEAIEQFGKNEKLV